MTIWDLIVSLGIDSKKFTDGIDAAEGKAKSGGSSIVSSLANVGGAVVTGALAAAGAGVVALGGFLATSVKAASDAEDIQAQLGAVLKSTGGVAGVTADQVNNLAGLYGRLTKFEDDAIVSGENMLLTFTNIGSNVFPDAAKTMLDMSQAMGTDLKGSAIQLGKALNNPTEGITALTRVGVAFTDQQKKQIEALQKAGKMEEAQAIILKELQTEFGGAAVAAGKTFAGQLTILKNSFGNIQETVGGALLPVLTKLATTMTEKLANPKVLAAIEGFATGVADFAIMAIEYLPQVIGWFTNLTDAFQEGLGFAGDAMDGIINVFYKLGETYPIFNQVGDTLMDLVMVFDNAKATISTTVQTLVTNIQKWWSENGTAVMAVVNTMWGQVQTVFQAAGTFISTLVSFVLNNIQLFWQNHGTAVMAFVNGLWSAIQTIFTTVTSVITSIFQAFTALLQGDWATFGNKLVEAATTAWNGIKTAIETIGEGIKGIILSLIKSVVGFFTSTDWAKVGRDIADGIARGILSAVGAVASAAKALWDAAQVGGNGGIGSGMSPAQIAALQKQYVVNTGPTPTYYSGEPEQYASGGSFVIPSRYGYEGYPLGPGKTASGGETVTVTPEGGGAGIDYNKLAIVFRDTLLQVLQ
jgi:hypothetical protein